MRSTLRAIWLLTPDPISTDPISNSIGQARFDAETVCSVVRSPGNLGGDLVSACEGFRQTVQRSGWSASANRRTSFERQFAPLPHSPGNP